MLTLEVSTFLENVVPYASEIITKSYGPNFTNVKTHTHNKKYTFVDKTFDAILEEVSVAETTV